MKQNTPQIGTGAQEPSQAMQRESGSSGLTEKEKALIPVDVANDAAISGDQETEKSLVDVDNEEDDAGRKKIAVLAHENRCQNQFGILAETGNMDDEDCSEDEGLNILADEFPAKEFQPAEVTLQSPLVDGRRKSPVTSVGQENPRVSQPHPNSHPNPDLAQSAPRMQSNSENPQLSHSLSQVQPTSAPSVVVRAAQSAPQSQSFLFLQILKQNNSHSSENFQSSPAVNAPINDTSPVILKSIHSNSGEVFSKNTPINAKDNDQSPMDSINATSSGGRASSPMESLVDFPP
ncbi:OLC1v1001736C1 [Oldenlandia corymbosa var. corymbosa]|uniref:OLC1v1001736C1 n=1 Tax=Oldenlandia corymbosa var. corymbosa TaxID=529605 RepID=A0AAV1D678_OLDCO|nr:OLC1v1001736C1 [Oldenlandia corymbosa var. corymbosa]